MKKNSLLRETIKIKNDIFNILMEHEVHTA